MIDMALGEPEENIQYDSLEPNYGRQDNEQEKENRQIEGKNSEVC